jgi:hypothetical protein
MSFRPQGEIYTHVKWIMPMYRFLAIATHDMFILERRMSH